MKANVRLAKFTKLVMISMLVSLILIGCQLPPQTAEPEPDVDQISTQVVQTLVIALTETAESQPTVTATSLPTETPLPTATALPTETPTQVPTATTMPTNTVVYVYVPPAATATPAKGVSVSTTSAAPGESFTATAYGFSSSVDVDFRLNSDDGTTAMIVDGYTDSSGSAAVVLTIPSSADSDDTYVVYVTTTEISPVETGTSSTIWVDDDSTETTSGSGYVLLSSTSLSAGDTFTVSISGYPESEDVDFKLGEVGESVSVVADGSTDSNGSAAVLMTIPSDADTGDSWQVTVHTTNLVDMESHTSDTITITD